MAEQYIKIKGDKFKIGVDLFLFKEDEQVIAYSPALEISSYGDTYDDAENAFQEATDIFITYSHKKGTLVADLLELGWTITKKPKAVFRAPDLEDTIKDNPILQSLISSGQYQRTQTNMAIPAMV